MLGDGLAVERTVAPTAKNAPKREAPPRGLLRPRTRKTLLILHLAAMGAWLGIDVVFAVLAGIAFTTTDHVTLGVAYEAMGWAVCWPMPVAAGLTLGTGVLLSLGTRYGLVRYWWVLVKLVVTVAMTVLVLVPLRPDVDGLAAVSRELITDGEPYGVPFWLPFPPTVGSTLVILLTVISVFKPWGRTRRRTGPAVS